MKLRESTCLIWVLGMCFVAMFTGCEMRPSVQGPGESSLQGIWKQDSVPMQDKRLSYTLYEMRFTCDSVYIAMDVVDKTPLNVDSCTSKEAWKEYARGVYIVYKDTLMIEADFTWADGRYKAAGCYRTGQFLPRFFMASQGAGSLVLRERYTNRPIVMKKTEHITCVPKPL